jgi:hypothetical protein
VACSSSHIPKEHEFQLQKAFIEQAAQCDAFNVKGRTMPMTLPYTPGDMLRQSAIIQSSAYIGMAAILAVFIVAFATAPKARAQDYGHHLHHTDHYSKWKQPGTNASCCNGKETTDGQITGDCYPTTAEVRAGSWWAKRDDGQWVIVPDDRILRERNPDVERTHLCFNSGRVLCFVPPSTGT